MRLVVTNINLGLWAAAYIKEKINAFAPTPQKPFVLGLPTGGTVVDMYANLRLFYKAGLLDFKNVVTFNMDEYVGISPDHPQSYHSYMRNHLFDAVNLQPQNTHILNGNAPDPAAECAAFEAAIARLGGIDLFVGGVGRNGCNDFVLGHFAVGGKIGVAKGAGAVASAETDKDCGAAGKVAFALERIEDFVYFHRR